MRCGADVNVNCKYSGPSLDGSTVGDRLPSLRASELEPESRTETRIGIGAPVSTNFHSSRQLRETETTLTLAGREGQMKAFQVLVDAGAQINVRSGDGETPLTSVAQCDYTVGVQSLISLGGCLRYEDVRAHECSLVPGTLATTATLCEATFEFEALSAGVLRRMQDICKELQQSEAVHEATLVSFTFTIFGFCRFLTASTSLAVHRTSLDRFQDPGLSRGAGPLC